MNNELIQFGESRKKEEPISKVFAYNGTNVTFARKGNLTMVNATEMAKPFNKTTKDWLRTESSKEFISSLSAVRHFLPSEMVKIMQGCSPEQSERVIAAISESKKCVSADLVKVTKGGLRLLG